LDFIFIPLFGAFRLVRGIFFRHAKDLEGIKTNRKRKIRSIWEHTEEDFSDSRLRMPDLTIASRLVPLRKISEAARLAEE
jgi:hypothetical protein